MENTTTKRISRTADVTRKISSAHSSELRRGSVRISHYATVGAKNTQACNGREIVAPYVINSFDRQYLICSRCEKLAKSVRPILIADLVQDANGIEYRLFVDVDDEMLEGLTRRCFAGLALEAIKTAALTVRAEVRP